MKRGFAIFLLSLFLLHYSGFYVFFTVRLISIHKENREKIENESDDQFEIIQLSAFDYKKATTAENEIEWKGKMYDIGRTTKSGDQFVLYVIHDKAEEDMLSFLDEIIKSSEGYSWEAPSQILAFISLIFVPNENIFRCKPAINPSQISIYLERFYSVTLPIDSPPPQSRA